MNSVRFPAKAVPSIVIHQIILASALVLFGCTILAFLGLIGLGQWESDEYVVFYHMRSGLPYFLERLGWSPRPISEPIFYLYGQLVNAIHRPMILPFLAAFWGIFLFAGLFTFSQILGERRIQSAWNHLLISLTLTALCLAGGNLTEVFYWPAGTVAYLPTLAATLLFFLQILDDRLSIPRSRFLAAVCLTVAAGSSEMGATFVMSYILVRCARRRLSKIRRHSDSERSPLFWLAVPAVVAMSVLIVVRMDRFNAHEVADQNLHTLQGHPMLSFFAGLKGALLDFIGRDLFARYPHPAAWFHLGAGVLPQMIFSSRIPMEILLAIGVVLWQLPFHRMSRPQIGSIIDVCAAFMVASIFTITAANLHFGDTCCERHQLLRECWMVMTITGVSTSVAGSLSGSMRARLYPARFLAPILLCAAVLSLGFMGPLIQTYRVYRPLYAASEANFASGFRPSTDQMSFLVLPPTEVIDVDQLSPGVFAESRSDQTSSAHDDYPDCIMEFFRKDKITIQLLQIAAR